MSKEWKWRNKHGKYRKFYLGFDFIEPAMGNRTLGISHRTNKMFDKAISARWLELHFWFGSFIIHYVRQK